MTRDTLVGGLRITIINILLYTVPSIVFLIAALKQGVVDNRAIVSVLLVFCFVRSSLMFCVYYFLHCTFAESAKSFVKEVIPLKIMRFKARYGCLELNP